MNKEKKDIKKLFIPLYIDKNKLLDVNSILFDGYSEFSEITLEKNTADNKESKATINGKVDFKLFKIGSELNENNNESEDNKYITSLKKVQTTSSLLSSTLTILRNIGALKKESYKIGDFIEIKGEFKNNSIIDLMDQLLEMFNFAELALKLDKNNTSNKNFNKEKSMIKSFKELLKNKNENLRELVYVTEEKIFVINIDLSYLYNSNINNIYDLNLTCFGQVRNIKKDFKFFSDTQLTKFNNESIEQIINALYEFKNNGAYKLDFELIKDNKDKEVVEIDIIAIYRNMEILQ